MKLSTQIGGAVPTPGFDAIERDRSGQRHSVMKEIELRFASTLVELSLPKSTGMFGKGLSGSVARSALVERLSHALAQSDAIGIAKATQSQARPFGSVSGVLPVATNS